MKATVTVFKAHGVIRGASEHPLEAARVARRIRQSDLLRAVGVGQARYRAHVAGRAQLDDNTVQSIWRTISEWDEASVSDQPQYDRRRPSQRQDYYSERSRDFLLPLPPGTPTDSMTSMPPVRDMGPITKYPITRRPRARRARPSPSKIEGAETVLYVARCTCGVSLAGHCGETSREDALKHIAEWSKKHQGERCSVTSEIFPDSILDYTPKPLAPVEAGAPAGGA